MNQEQAKKFIELYATLRYPEVVFNNHHVANLEHIERFSKVGVYQWRDFYGEWISTNDIIFCGEPENYRPVPESKINWEKAMKNGAWGQEFIINGSAQRLLGYHPDDSLPFASHIAGHYARSNDCNPLPDFEVPNSWLEDEEK